MRIYDTTPPLTDPPFVANGSCTHGIEEDCSDFVGNPNGVNSFVKRTRITHYPLLNGQLFDGNGVLAHDFVGFPIADQAIPFDPTAHWGAITGIDLNNFAWAILAGTNPNVPHVSVPTVIGELKDLPSLIKVRGDGFLKKVAQAHLSWRWALRPMLSDLRKLCNFARAFDNRLMELYSLRDGRVMRRRCHLGNAKARTTNETNHWFHAGYGVLLQGTFQRFYTKEVWGTAQWKLDPDSVLPQLGFGPLSNLANRLNYGITSHEALAAAWELTPWSWLADWFSNIGDVIAATNNSVALHWQKICVMRYMTEVSDAKVDRSISTPWITLDSDYVLRYERKERFPCFPVLPFPFPTLPIIDGGKMSILASLAALRL
jgi:hypothetical protein